MREFWKKTWQFLKNPPVWFLVVAYVLAVASIAGALGLLFVDYVGTFLEIVAYAVFALAAITLAYVVFTIIPLVPKIKAWFLRTLEKHEFTRAIRHNYGHRTIIFAIGTFFMSVVYGVFNGYLGLVGKSIWYGALAAYYIFLAFIRGGVLAYHGKKHAGRLERENDDLEKAKTYRNSGILLLIVNTALSAAIAQMIFDDRFFSYADWTIFASAAYAFYKITMSIINLFKARKQDDLTIEAIRNINLMDATVSILALQTALLHTFQDGTVDVSIFNTLTGSAVSVFTLALGVYMILKATKKIKEIRMENGNGEQGV